jgi:hypothetical protein
MTLLALLILTEQVKFLPLHAPSHPPNLEPAETDAVRVTSEFAVKLPAQRLPQSIPAGLLVTRPLPLPFLVTVSEYVLPDDVLKVAMTLAAAFIVT